jgi:V-type H+-transporting ATPase subunit G
MDADRTKRVKEARDEAKKEIDSYKKTKDDEFKTFESEVRMPPQHNFSLGCNELLDIPGPGTRLGWMEGW